MPAITMPEWQEPMEIKTITCPNFMKIESLCKLCQIDTSNLRKKAEKFTPFGKHTFYSPSPD
jgi:hypothetical protein